MEEKRVQESSDDRTQKWYTRIVGIFFVLIVLSLVTDLLSFGHRPETWHKIFHILIGVVVLAYGWSNASFWRPFCLVNGTFFTFVAVFGIIFPDFGMLDAFNTTDTILHSIVGVTGLLIGMRQR